MPSRAHPFIRPLSFLAVATASLFVARSASADVVFVRANQVLPTALQNGGSWATAFKSLQDALAAATAGDEIWIAEGLYRPTTSTSRTESFVLKNGVHLLGGFAGTETLVSERNILAFPTVLSGEIGAPGLADNSFHVVLATNLTSLTIVDGLTITRGNADGAVGLNRGAAVHTGNAKVTLSSCIVRDNFATFGAIATSSTVADAALTCFQCVVTGNSGLHAIDAQGVSPTHLSHCTITDNPAGGIFYFGSGGATSFVANSIIYFNGDGSEGEQFFPPSPGASPTITACLIQGWDNVSPSSPTTLGSNPLFARPRRSRRRGWQRRRSPHAAGWLSRDRPGPYRFHRGRRRARRRRRRRDQRALPLRPCRQSTSRR